MLARSFSLFNRIRRCRAGTSLVEFSLLLPFIMGLMGGTLEFGRALQQYHIVNKGAANAGRYMARVLDETLCPSAGVRTLTGTTVDQAKILAQHGTFDPSAPLLIPSWGDSSPFNVSVNCVNNPAPGGVSDFRGAALQPVINVSTSFDYQDLGLFSMIRVLPGIDDTISLRITGTHNQLYIGG